MLKKMDREAVTWVVERLSPEWSIEKKVQKVEQYLLHVWGTTDDEEIKRIQDRETAAIELHDGVETEN